MLAVLAGLAAYVLYRNGKIRVLTLAAIPLLAFYLSFVATITIFARIPSHDAQYQLTLFWTYKAIAKGETHYIAEIFWNVVLFVPIGILVMLLLTGKIRRLTAVIGMLLSVAIEVTQLIFHLGLFEFDDIVHNTLGTVIGIGMFLLIRGVGKRLIGKR